MDYSKINEEKDVPTIDSNDLPPSITDETIETIQNIESNGMDYSKINEEKDVPTIDSNDLPPSITDETIETIQNIESNGMDYTQNSEYIIDDELLNYNNETYVIEAVEELTNDDSHYDLIGAEENIEFSYPGREHKSNHYSSSNVHDDDENLGDDFESTPWLPPNIEKAEAYYNDNVFREGNSSSFSCDITNAIDLGAGVVLYFKFAKTFAICFFIMSLLSLPALFFSISGSNIPLEYQDAMGLYSFTIGNIGYNKDSPTYAEDLICHDPVNIIGVNGTCIHVGDIEISSLHVSQLITAFEFLQIIVFFGTIYYLNDSTKKVKDIIERSECSASDYTIIVKGIPDDASVDQIIGFFSKKYNLNTQDFKGRPPVRGAYPVNDCVNSGLPQCLNTWIADCVVHTKIGSFIKSFVKQQNLMKNLYRLRAKLKMYADDTPHKNGPDPIKYSKVEKDLISTQADLELVTEAVLKENINKDENSTEDIKADSVCAFVTFQYCESMARCLEDYKSYSKFPWNLCVPDELKFRGQIISVRRAAEPDEIVWENLEVSWFDKKIRRVRTSIITFILIIMSFIMILQSSFYKNKFEKEQPSLGICKDLPRMFSGNLNYTDEEYLDMQYIRPIDFVERERLDNECKLIVPDSLYARYAIYDKNQKEYKYIGNVSISSCSSNICPVYQEWDNCPCVSTSDNSGDCKTYQCSSSDPFVQLNCREGILEFPSSTIGGCYCAQNLFQLLKNGGALSAIKAIDNGLFTSADPCYNFMVNYLQGSLLTYAAVFVTVFVNMFIVVALEYLSRSEAHVSIDNQKGSFMNKLFIAMFCNVALVVLLAYGRFENLPSFFKETHILDGPYNDFSFEWYGAVGTYFITTFVAQAVSPISAGLIDYLIMKPFKRWSTKKEIINLSGHSIVMQADLNDMQIGPVFDYTKNKSYLLMLMFLSMSFGPGLPILIPLSCITFTLYFIVDRYLICGYYQKPPHVGVGTMKIALGALYYAGIIRLLFGIWMFSNPDILVSFDSAEIYSAHVSSNANSASSYSGGDSRVGSRFNRSNVTPLVVLLIICIFVKLARLLISMIPIFSLLKCFFSFFSDLFPNHKVFELDSEGFINGWTIQKLNDPFRQEISPFSGPYYKYLKDKTAPELGCFHRCFRSDDIKFTNQEIKEGWKAMHDGNYISKVKVWRKQTKIRGVIKDKGSKKSTYEVIGDHGCYSYHLIKIPAYKMIMEALQQGIRAIKSYKSLKGNNRNNMYNNVPKFNPDSKIVPSQQKYEENFSTFESENYYTEEPNEETYEKPFESNIYIAEEENTFDFFSNLELQTATDLQTAMDLQSSFDQENFQELPNDENIGDIENQIPIEE